MNEPDALIREMARTWKEGGGDAMGFSWCQYRIFNEILSLEQATQREYTPRDVAQILCDNSPRCDDGDCTHTSNSCAEKP